MSSSNVCHCCLVPGCSKDVFREYYCNEKKEVYSAMLLNTLNISISHDTPNNKICEQCITELRRATEFKMKILNSSNYLATANCLKAEKEELDDFDDKISVDFDESHTLDERDTGQTFVIKLNPRNHIHQENEERSPMVDDAEAADELETGDTITEINEVTRSFSTERKEMGHQIKVKRKIKQSEPDSHKDLKQNSLILIFNSNLCLFKSLKTKFGCFISSFPC